mmetsp:Transcript_38432/g.93000  ORF Transcript_38432/g.93000 Transcript_38432/m.93000 type:complete len:429 (+) Transcript_38432:141-1427(+)
MDGCYRATVHKLTSYWYPSPLLKEQPDLPTAVKLLHQHNYLRDNQLRHIHQVDYPTSGVLLIGRTRKAAAVASESFVNRDARKTCLAIVHGHLKMDQEWPVLPETRLGAMSELERNYRQSKKPKFSRVGATFRGHLPPSTMFLKWQSAMRERIKRKDDSRTTTVAGSEMEKKEQAINFLKGERLKKRQKRGTVLEPKELDEVIDEWMNSFSEEEITALLNVTKWREVKDNPKWATAIERLAEKYNSVLKAKNDTILNPSIAPLPRLFRIEGEDETESFYIHASCAQDKEKYKMVLHPDAQPFDKTILPAPQEELESLDFKPALTRCTIVARGTLNGHPVTKVKLEPRTGRRHQLRLHMVTVGCPILGDIAYEYKSNPKNVCRRMCLHAHHLSLMLVGGQQEFLARDPFLEEEGGKIFRVVIPGYPKTE